MTEKERELRALFAQVDAEAMEHQTAGRLDDYERCLDRMDNIKRELDLHLRAAALKSELPAVTNAGVGALETEGRAATVSAEERAHQERELFMRSIRRGGVLTPEERAASVGTKTSDGLGLTVPQDIVTKIRDLKRTFNPLEPFVTVESVNTMTGTRLLEKLTDVTPFAEVDEGGQFQAIDDPKVAKINYAIKKYGGMLTLTGELLQDSDEALEARIVRWFALKDVATKNAKILEVLKKAKATTVTTPDDMKAVFNKGIDPILAASSVIVTNQSGFNVLDTWKNEKGEYLMQQDITNPTQHRFGGKPVYVLADRALPNESNKAPIFMGALSEACVLFDRNKMTLDGTPYAAGAFETWTYKYRGLNRFDVQGFDLEAMLYGQIALA